MSKSPLWCGGQVSGVPLGRRMLWQRAGRGICPCTSHRRRVPCSPGLEAETWLGFNTQAAPQPLHGAPVVVHLKAWSKYF